MEGGTIIGKFYGTSTDDVLNLAHRTMCMKGNAISSFSAGDEIYVTIASIGNAGGNWNAASYFFKVEKLS